MEWLIGLIITTLVVALGLLIISKLPIGVEIDSLMIAIVSAIVFGVLNGVLNAVNIFKYLPFGLGWIAVLIVNIITFGLAAWAVKGFRLKNGVISAALGSIALTLFTGIVNYAITPKSQDNRPSNLNQSTQKASPSVAPAKKPMK
jgi:putative membrane protein